MNGWVSVNEPSRFDLNLNQVRKIEYAEGGIRVTYSNGDKEFFDVGSSGRHDLKQALQAEWQRAWAAAAE
jgi:hypothetical protein